MPEQSRPDRHVTGARQTIAAIAASPLGARWPWLVVFLVATYLALVSASHSLLDVPLPVLGGVALPVALVIIPRVRGRFGSPGGRVAPRPVEALVALAVVAILLTDVVLFQSPALRDLALYLRAGWFANHDLAVYLDAPMTYLPSDPTRLPFLYPPLTLPLFGGLTRLPWPLVASVWVVLSIAAALVALRLFGLSWRWSTAFLFWPPFAEGLYVGNVAVPALLLFAAGLRAGAALPLGTIFKLQAGIPSLWLVRERRVPELVAGAALLLVLVVGTLPAVGVHRWSEWVDGLLSFRESETRYPALFGHALSGLLPAAASLVAAGVAILIAARSKGQQGLARFGVAAIVTSPSLYSHGFLVGLPSFLALNRFWFWVAIGCTASVWGYGWWAAVIIAVVAWRYPAMTHRAIPSEDLHPLRGAVGPWQRPFGWGPTGAPIGTDRKVASDA